MKTNYWIVLGGLNGLLAVAIGAFGAHGLKHLLTGDLREIFETGARYHMYHALALLVVGLVSAHRPGRVLTSAGLLFQLGIILFSGSLYALAITANRGLGAITPLGGGCFLVAWLLLVVSARKFGGGAASVSPLTKGN